MSKCLVTKLKGVVDDDSFKRYGEVRVSYTEVDTPTAASQGISLQFSKTVTLEIVGDGYFTDKYLQQNLGKTLAVAADTDTDIYSSNGNYQISISDKYAITRFRTFPVEYQSEATAEIQSNKTFSINDLRYAEGLQVVMSNSKNTTGAIVNITNKVISTISLGNTAVVGSLTNLVFPKTLTTLILSKTLVEGTVNVLCECTNLRTIIINDTAVVGRIDMLSELTELTSVNLANTKVKGAVSSLVKLTKLENIDFFGTQVSGTISDIAGLTLLQHLRIPNMTGNIGDIATLTKLKTCTLNYANLTGDLSKMPESCYFVSFDNDNGSSLSWTSRAASANILAMSGTASLSNCDKMLSDQSKGVVAIPASGESWYKRISISGEYTNVQTLLYIEVLRSKGYTVTIPQAKS